MKTGYWVSKSGRESVVHLVDHKNHPICGALPSGEFCIVGNGIQAAQVTCRKCARRAVELIRRG